MDSKKRIRPVQKMGRKGLESLKVGAPSLRRALIEEKLFDKHIGTGAAYL
jgi:hypothetical protein